MPAIAPIKILKPNVNPRKIPVIDANKIESIKVIPKIVNCNFVYSSFELAFYLFDCQCQIYFLWWSNNSGIEEIEHSHQKDALVFFY